MDENDNSLLSDWQTAAAKHYREQQEAAPPWLANPAQPYVLTFDGPEAARPHRFCGANDIPGADCPQCKRRLTQVATFTTAHLPFTLGPTPPPAIPVLYCWPCLID